MATTTKQDTIAAFTQSLERSAATLGQGRGLARMFCFAVALFKGERQSRQALTAMCAALSLCAKACETGACMAEVYLKTKAIRDNYLSSMVFDVPKLATENQLQTSPPHARISL